MPRSCENQKSVCIHKPRVEGEISNYNMFDKPTGCPYDNAAMENFFGTLKTECLYRARLSSRAEVEQLVTEYVHFYNFEHISLKNGLTPVEFRSKAA